MPQMIITLNYLIAAMAFLAAFLLKKRGSEYMNSSRFMFFLGFAALLGGFVHHMEQQETALTSFIPFINTKLPSFFEPLDFNLIKTRLWYIAIVSIGFAEFYFMFLFIDPLIKGKFEFIKTYLKIALGIYLVITLISAQYLFVVAFHIFSHVFIICFALYCYLKDKITAFLWLAILAGYNLAIGIMQQLMANNIIATGHLNYNDWYHLGVIIFVIFLYFLFTKGKLIEKLNHLHSQNNTTYEKQ